MTLKLLGHDVSLKRNVQALAFKAEEANPQRIEDSAGEDSLPNIWASRVVGELPVRLDLMLLPILSLHKYKRRQLSFGAS